MAKASTSKKGATKRISPYNKFIKTELARLKENDPELSHKDAFRQAAANWGKSSENPKSKKNN